MTTPTASPKDPKAAAVDAIHEAITQYVSRVNGLFSVSAEDAARLSPATKAKLRASVKQNIADDLSGIAQLHLELLNTVYGPE